jgi:hypothetical protein
VFARVFHFFIRWGGDLVFLSIQELNEIAPTNEEKEEFALARFSHLLPFTP